MNLARCRYPPREQQLLGIDSLVKLSDPDSGRVIPGCFSLFDEMGVGKSKQVVDAAQVLRERGEIDRVIIVAPASVAWSVWWDAEYGEIAKHLWMDDAAHLVVAYHSKNREWHKVGERPGLTWIVANYELLRREDRLAPILGFANKTTWLVLDESSAVKNHRAVQTKACNALRKLCGRVTLLNGTPVSNSPMDMYAQGAVMSPRITACKNYFHFRARYAVMGGFMKKQILEYKNLEDLRQRFKPYVLRRLKRDCLDLPPKLPPVALVATLTKETWKVYRDLREEFLAWLDSATPIEAPQAGARAMRLAQVAAGFVGGLKDENGEALPERAVGTEKFDLVRDWILERVEEHDGEGEKFKVVIWCRFRPELRRLLDWLDTTDIAHGAVWGDQSRDERVNAIRLLHPDTTEERHVVVLGTPGAGAKGITLAGAGHVLYSSNDPSLEKRLQSEDRVDRPGQTHAGVWYGDVIAEGPGGQKTTDHIVMRALREKNDVATWTCEAWRQAVRDQVEAER